MNKRFSLIALLLAVSVLLTSCGFDLSEEEIRALYYSDEAEIRGTVTGETELLTGTGRDAIVPFGEIEYVRPDIQVLEDQVTQAVALVDENASMEDIMTALDDCHFAYYTFYTMRSLAEIYCYHDMSDSYWTEEFDFCDASVTEVERLLEQLYIGCARSALAAELEAQYFGEGFVDYYGTDYTGYTDEAYSALLQKEAEILAEYRALRAGLTVEYRGEEVSYYDLLADPALTDEEYYAVEDAYYEKYTPLFGELYIRLINTRNEIADYCGYDSYEAYAFDMLYGRDYTAEQADALVADIRTYIAPVYRELLEENAWMNVTYDWLDEAELVAQIDGVAAQMGGEIEEVWDFLDEYDLYDVTLSSQKVDMSFQTYLEDYEAPFAFIKTEGYNDDLLTFVHEFGHCVDAYVNYNDTYSLELAETFSQAMEYLLLCYGGEVLSPDELENLTAIKLLDTLDTYAQQGSFADFERQVYSLPEDELTVEAINAISLQTAIDYGFYEAGYESYYALSWIDIVHFFEQPYYVISYCVSNDAAFQIYQMELEETGAGLDVFYEILPREYEGFLDTILEQGGMESPFAEGRMESTAETILACFR